MLADHLRDTPSDNALLAVVNAALDRANARKDSLYFIGSARLHVDEDDGGRPATNVHARDSTFPRLGGIGPSFFYGSP